LDAIKKENITWPVNYQDFFPYAAERYEYWTGFFTSRPGLKKQVKTYSSLFHAQSRLFARRMIHQNASDSEI
jgi:alpha-mannosidase